MRALAPTPYAASRGCHVQTATRIVDGWGFPLADPDGVVIGIPPVPPLRVVQALKMKHGPRQLSPAEQITDAWGFGLADASGTVVGRPAVVIARVIVARLSDAR